LLPSSDKQADKPLVNAALTIPRLNYHSIQSSELFQRVLALRPCAGTRYFAIHFLPDPILRSKNEWQNAPEAELFTFDLNHQANSVDNIVDGAEYKFRVGLQLQVCPLFLGLVVPKRFARRAVTRSLIKRQIRAAFQAYIQSSALNRWVHGSGAWVVRMRAGFDLQQYPSAASLALRARLRAELHNLFQLLV
jgi:ribonuclease P protein component